MLFPGYIGLGKCICGERGRIAVMATLAVDLCGMVMAHLLIVAETLQARRPSSLTQQGLHGVFKGTGWFVAPGSGTYLDLRSAVTPSLNQMPP